MINYTEAKLDLPNRVVDAFEDGGYELLSHDDNYMELDISDSYYDNFDLVAFYSSMDKCYILITDAGSVYTIRYYDRVGNYDFDGDAIPKSKMNANMVSRIIAQRYNSSGMEEGRGRKVNKLAVSVPDVYFLDALEKNGFSDIWSHSSGSSEATTGYSIEGKRKNDPLMILARLKRDEFHFHLTPKGSDRFSDLSEVRTYGSGRAFLSHELEDPEAAVEIAEELSEWYDKITAKVKAGKRVRSTEGLNYFRSGDSSSLEGKPDKWMDRQGYRLASRGIIRGRLISNYKKLGRKEPFYENPGVEIEIVETPKGIVVVQILDDEGVVLWGMPQISDEKPTTFNGHEFKGVIDRADNYARRYGSYEESVGGSYEDFIYWDDKRGGYRKGDASGIMDSRTGRRLDGTSRVPL